MCLLQDESAHGSLLQFRVAELREDLYLLKVWQDFLFIDEYLLALKHNDVLVVLIDLAVSIRSP